MAFAQHSPEIATACAIKAGTHAEAACFREGFLLK
jgi:hypothetical protein